MSVWNMRTPNCYYFIYKKESKDKLPDFVDKTIVESQEQ